MTKREARKIVRWFQKYIGLLGWAIIIKDGPCPGRKEDEDDGFGACIPDVTYRTATIWIDREAHSKYSGDLSDESHTLVHELLHVFFAECDIQSSGEHAEWGINQLASMLLKQYRADQE